MYKLVYVPFLYLISSSAYANAEDVINLADKFKTLMFLVVGLVGLINIINGVLDIRLKSLGKVYVSNKKICMQLFVGMVFFSFSAWLIILVTTVYGKTPPDFQVIQLHDMLQNYTFASSKYKAVKLLPPEVMRAIIAVTTIIGMIGIYYGFSACRNNSFNDRPKTSTARIIIFLLCGIALIQVDQTFCIIGNTFHMPELCTIFK